MANRSCPNCGNPLQGFESSCSECGMSFSSKIQYSSGMPNHDEGDNEAENFLRKIINIIKNVVIIFSIIIGVLLIVSGAATLSKFGLIGLAQILVGIFTIILGIFIARLSWALCMIFINISTNVRNIKQILKNK